MEKKFTHLSDNELNEVTGGAGVTGSFSWDKSPEEITTDPEKKMDVIFTPTDTENYDWN